MHRLRGSQHGARPRVRWGVTDTDRDLEEPDSPPLVPAPSPVPGAEAPSPAHLGWDAWKAVLKRVYVMNDFHSLPLLAAGMAFYAFLALVPAIAAVVMIYGLIGDVATVAAHMQTIIALVPPDAAAIIRDQLLAIVTANEGVTGLALAIALFFSFYGAMRAAGATIQALNMIYEEHETRSLLGFYWLSARLTLGGIGIALIGVIAASVFAWLENTASGMIGPQARTAAQIVTWAAAAALASVGFAGVYRYAPDRHQAKWRWLSVGSLLATLLWVAATFGFGLYATYVTDYNATYGSLGAVVVLLMWLWLSSYAVLIGALVNAESERQTERDSTVGPDRPMGERGAVIADAQALDQASVYLLEKKRLRQAEREARRTTRAAFGLPRRGERIRRELKDGL
jgi:membrane protein